MTQAAIDRITSTVDFNISGLVSGYILTCKSEGKSPHTIEFYQSILRRFLWYAEAHNFSQNPQEINRFHIAEFLSYLRTEATRWGGTSNTACLPVNQNTVRHYYRSLYTFFKWLREEGFITENPVAHIRSPRVSRKIIQALGHDDMQALLDHCSQKTAISCRNKAIVMMFLDTGIRSSELAALRQADVDMKTGTIVVRSGKGGKPRVVRIGFTAQKALWRYLTLSRKGEGGSLFVSKSGNPLTSRSVELMVRRLGKTANIPNVHAHRLRHTFAISFLRAGGDIFTLKYLLGHSSLTMVQNYLGSLNAEDAIGAHQRFSPADNLGLR